MLTEFDHSGKSSSTLAILRLIDMATVPGSILREKLTCLTQDPFLFPASIRSNVYHFNKPTDEAIITALQTVGLWDVLKEKATDKTSGSSAVLDTLMDAEFLSHGQRQLFCLARAMLNPGKVLILDEPTSRQVEILNQRAFALYWLRENTALIPRRILRCRILSAPSFEAAPSS